jgi:hypothetical protein
MIHIPGTGATSTAADEENHMASSEKDAALTIVSSETALQIDPVVERRVLRKIDLFLMPAMLIGMIHRLWS